MSWLKFFKINKVTTETGKYLTCGSLDALTLVLCSVTFLALNAEAKVKVDFKTSKDTTQVTLVGSTDWQYKVERKSGDRPLVDIQFNGVSSADLIPLTRLTDSRVKQVEVFEGVNNSARVVISLNDNKFELFDYQTEQPAKLIFDIYKNEVQKKKQKKVTKQDALATLVKKSDKRKPASADYLTVPDKLANQGLDAKGIDSQFKYGIFDGGDPQLNRFRSQHTEPTAEMKIKMTRELYLRFPELVVEQNSPEEMFKETPTYFVTSKTDDEAQMAKLVVQLVKENKMAVALRTLKFFREKYPESQYKKTLAFVEADCFYKLWLRDHDLADFESAIARYRELIKLYPTDEQRYRLSMFVGLNYMKVANYPSALTTFQVAIKDFPESPYYWQMRLAKAEVLRLLHKDGDALKELADIENDPRSGSFGINARFRRGDVPFLERDYVKADAEYSKAKTAYPTKLNEAPNVFFNRAEGLFWQKKYADSLNEFREFLQRFPGHSHGGYAMTRVGELLEILGEPESKVTGAYLESFFRYKGSPGAYVARLHINSKRFKKMKDKEFQTALKLTKEEMPKEAFKDVETHFTITESDGLTERKKYEESYEKLLRYYQQNPMSEYLPIVRERIVENLKSMIEVAIKNKDPVKAISILGDHRELWFSKSNRIDTKFLIGRAYESLNILDEAQKIYSENLKNRESLKGEELIAAKLFEDLPTPSSIRLRLSKTYLEMGDIKNANENMAAIDLTQLTEAERIEKSLIQASMAEKEERNDLAIKSLTELTEKWKGQNSLLVEPWLRLAKVYNEKAQYKEALSWISKIQEVVKSKTANVSDELLKEVYALSGDLYSKTNNTKQGIENYEKYLEKFSQDDGAGYIRYKLGMIYFNENNLRDARRVWSALKKDPKSKMWAQMSEEKVSESEWMKNYKRYVDRYPAGGNQ